MTCIGVLESKCFGEDEIGGKISGLDYHGL